jgi:hypothetical protein
MIRQLARVSAVPVLVRAGVFAAALAALLLAAPPALRLAPPVLAAMILVAALPAVLPGGPWAIVSSLATAAGWLLATDGGGSYRVIVLAGLLYCVHTLSALAAALPYDAIVAPDVIVRWLLRAVVVVAAGSLLSVAVLAGLDAAAGAKVHAAATVAGLALAVALAIVLRRLVGRSATRRGYPPQA